MPYFYPNYEIYFINYERNKTDRYERTRNMADKL